MDAKHLLLILIASLILTACGAPATPAVVTLEPTTLSPAPTVTPEPVDPATIAQSFYQAYNAGDIEALMALVAEDVKCRGGGYLTGKDRFRLLLEHQRSQHSLGVLASLVF